MNVRSLLLAIACVFGGLLSNPSAAAFELIETPSPGVDLYRQSAPTRNCTKPPPACSPPGTYPAYQYILAVDLKRHTVELRPTDVIADVSEAYRGKAGEEWANKTDAEWASFRSSYSSNKRYTGKKLVDIVNSSYFGTNVTAIVSAALGGRYPKQTNAYSSGNITFPVVQGGSIETEGYADPNSFHQLDPNTGQPGTFKLSDYRVLCIDNVKDMVKVLPYHDVRTSVACPHEVVSYAQTFPMGAGPDGRRDAGRVSVAAADADGDGQNDIVLIYAATSDYQLDPRDNLSAFINLKYPRTIGREVIQFDGGGSAQLWVKGTMKIASSRPLFNWFVVDANPTLSSVSINNGASSTTSRTVTLNNSASGSPTHHIASESSSFYGASWSTYSPSPSFTLNSGNGTKTVYFKVKNPAGESSTKSDTISLSEVSASRLQNRWKTGVDLSVNGNTQWVLEGVNGYYRIKEAQSSRYLNIETGSLQSTTIQSGWYSAQWALVSTDSGYYKIQNRWQPTQYIHIEYGAPQAGIIQTGWWSAQWKFL